MKDRVKVNYNLSTWQPATDLKGQDNFLLEFHQLNPDKPGPPALVKGRRALNSEGTTPNSTQRAQELQLYGGELD
jgi:hypothetical protein